jgi:hypothetical protein
MANILSSDLLPIGQSYLPSQGQLGGSGAYGQALRRYRAVYDGSVAIAIGDTLEIARSIHPGSVFAFGIISSIAGLATTTLDLGYGTINAAGVVTKDTALRAAAVVAAGANLVVAPVAERAPIQPTGQIILPQTVYALVGVAGFTPTPAAPLVIDLYYSQG